MERTYAGIVESKTGVATAGSNLKLLSDSMCPGSEAGQRS